MTVAYLTLAALKEAKNSIIGNPTAKRALARDDTFIGMLVACIQGPESLAESSGGSQTDLRVEAAHVLSSLSYGPSDSLQTLLKLAAPQAFMVALSNLSPSDPPSLKAALARGLRVITVAIADAVGPSEWGLQRHAPDAHSDAKDTLDSLFQIDALDVYLPLLCDPSTQTSTSIALLLANSIRLPAYRTAVSEWLPPNERHKEVKGKRGWEKADNPKSPSRSGGWAARQLTAMLYRKDAKVQEAALLALATLARDNAPVAVKLTRASPDQQSVLSTVLSLCKSRLVDSQIAACLCAASIVRAGYSPQYLHIDHSSAMTVIHVVNAMISSETEKPAIRTKACFILYQLVADDKDLCQLAYDRGSLLKLATLVKAITPSEVTPEWDEDEPETTSRLCEAALTAIAAIALFDNDIRNDVTAGLQLTPYIQLCLAHHYPGVRYAACQCVRALSRAVSVLRTSIIDSGLGLAVYQVFSKEDEDLRVRHAASSVVCNLMTDFSPLRETLLQRGVMAQLVNLLGSSERGLQLNALWTFKNLLYKSKMDLKKQVMEALGWDTLQRFLVRENPEFQEEAFHLVRNLAGDEAGIEMVFDGLGSNTLLDSVSQGLESDSDGVLRQATYTLGNLVNNTTHQPEILAHPRILLSLRQCLVDAKVDVRRPAVSCVRELIRANPHAHRELHEAGIDATLRHMCDYGGGLISSSPTTSTLSMGVEEDSEVRDKAREALRWLERSGEMRM